MNGGLEWCSGHTQWRLVDPIYSEPKTFAKNTKALHTTGHEPLVRSFLDKMDFSSSLGRSFLDKMGQDGFQVLMIL